VPAELSGELEKPMSIDRPLYRVPSFSIVAPGGAAIVLGMARSALEEIVSLAAAKSAAGNPDLAQRASVQDALARADAELRAARLLLLDCAAELDRTAAAGLPVTDQQRGDLRGAMSHANLVGRKVLTSMYELGGSTSLYRANRVERIVRDGLAAAQHTNNSPVHFELAGQLLLGLTPESPVY
jgi:alkylation response protein AidB-like acyl-CoA dehydrogenase